MEFVYLSVWHGYGVAARCQERVDWVWVGGAGRAVARCQEKGRKQTGCGAAARCQERASCRLELESQAAVRQTWLLGNKPGTSKRTARARDS